MRRVVARGLSHRFGGTVALRSLDAMFDAGEIIAVEGPNGAGKSTLLGILGTRIAPSAGEVLYDPAPASREALRASIGWLAHDALVYPDLDCRQNLRLMASLYGVPFEPAWDRAVSRLGLGGFAERPVRTYSRGQKQRIALARALLHDPSLLLLDEPTAGLDAEGLRRLVAILREEAARGAIVVLVTHDPWLVDEVATRRLRIEKGRRVEPAAGVARGAGEPG